MDQIKKLIIIKVIIVCISILNMPLAFITIITTRDPVILSVY